MRDHAVVFPDAQQFPPNIAACFVRVSADLALVSGHHALNFKIVASTRATRCNSSREPAPPTSLPRRQRIGSSCPSEKTTLPPPDHVPDMRSNGPGCGSASVGVIRKNDPKSTKTPIPRFVSLQRSIDALSFFYERPMQRPSPALLVARSRVSG